MTDNEYWYRYEDVKYAAPIDEYERPIGEGRVEVRLRKYRVIKHTPKGVWISQDFWFTPHHDHIYPDNVNKKFVLRDARKRFACPTIEEALESFKARKKRQIRILRAQARDAEKALEKADKEHERQNNRRAP